MSITHNTQENIHHTAFVYHNNVLYPYINQLQHITYLMSVASYNFALLSDNALKLQKNRYENRRTDISAKRSIPPIILTVPNSKFNERNNKRQRLDDEEKFQELIDINDIDITELDKAKSFDKLIEICKTYSDLPEREEIKTKRTKLSHNKECNIYQLEDDHYSINPKIMYKLIDPLEKLQTMIGMNNIR